MRRLEHGIAHNAEISITLVVGHDEDDVRSLLSEESSACEADERGKEIFEVHESVGILVRRLY